MNQIALTINDKEITVPQGTLLIEAAQAAGIYIPRFCYHKKLSVAANCRMCLVQVAASPRKPLPACATTVSPGMVVHTQSKMTVEAQKSVMEFLLINHPLDCPVCDQAGECELQDLAMGYGSSVSRFTEGKRAVQDKDLGPLIATEMTRCIHCTRCVRFGQEIAGLPELGATGRGEHMEIGTYIEKSMQSELSGNIIDLCPVGALTSKPYRFTGRSWEMRQHRSIAPHDCVGSHIYVHTRRHPELGVRQVMRVLPRENQDINETWISDRDRFSYQGLSSADRLVQPLIKKSGHWHAVSWSDALTEVADKLGVILKHSGPQSLGALTGPSATLESYYFLQKFMRALGSANIDHRIRETDHQDQEKAPFYPGLSIPFAAWSGCSHIVIIGSDMRYQQPLAAHRIRQAALSGTRIVVINPSDNTPNCPIASQWCTGRDALPQALASLVKVLYANTGAELPSEAVRWIAEAPDAQEAHHSASQLIDLKKTAVILGNDAFNHPNAAAIRSLSHLIARALNTHCSYLTTGANTAGAWMAGAVPHRLPGGQSTASVGYTAHEMLTQPLSGYVLHDLELDRDTAHPKQAMATIKQSDFVVSLSVFDGPALRDYADVILPIVPFTETDGTFVNAQGDCQSFKSVCPPLQEARPSCQALSDLAKAMGLSGFDVDASHSVVQACAATTASPSMDGWSWFMPKLNAEAPLPTWHMYDEDGLVRRATALQESRKTQVQ